LEEWADLEIWTQKEGHFQHAAVGQNPVQTVSWLSVVEEGQGKKDGGPLLPQTRRELGARNPECGTADRPTASAGPGPRLDQPDFEVPRLH
jgi:hypothetical protein